jgi:hypothetical protein
VLGADVLATAILDRLLHRYDVINIKVDLVVLAAAIERPASLFQLLRDGGALRPSTSCTSTMSLLGSSGEPDFAI